jgi:hypothetical protein
LCGQAPAASGSAPRPFCRQPRACAGRWRPALSQRARAGRPIRTAGFRFLEDPGKHVGVPVDLAGGGVVASGDPADVLGHWRVGGRRPWTVHHLREAGAMVRSVCPKAFPAPARRQEAARTQAS